MTQKKSKAQAKRKPRPTARRNVSKRPLTAAQTRSNDSRRLERLMEGAVEDFNARNLTAAERKLQQALEILKKYARSAGPANR